jgi:hypothetical protein
MLSYTTQNPCFHWLCVILENEYEKKEGAQTLKPKVEVRQADVVH